MRYSVWSRGRQIGETDLEFMRLVNKSRSGTFHPNEEGERVMPVIAAALPAMRAYLHRDVVDEAGNGLVHPSMYGSTAFADLAEAFQHLDSLDLELRREDGSVVPTSEIGIQDTERLLALADEDDTKWDADDMPLFPTEHDRQLQADIDHDAALIEEGMDVDDDDVIGESIPFEFEIPHFPRYQIHVLLLDEHAIP